MGKMLQQLIVGGPEGLSSQVVAFAHRKSVIITGQQASGLKKERIVAPASFGIVLCRSVVE